MQDECLFVKMLTSLPGRRAVEPKGGSAFDKVMWLRWIWNAWLWGRFHPSLIFISMFSLLSLKLMKCTRTRNVFKSHKANTHTLSVCGGYRPRRVNGSQIHHTSDHCLFIKACVHQSHLPQRFMLCFSRSLIWGHTLNDWFI